MGKYTPEQNREYQKRHYEKNKEYYYKKTKKRMEKVVEWFSEYKNNLSCSKCGESHVATLDFHHRNPSEKEENISHVLRRGWGIERIKSEIGKCDVLCANCHRKLHWEERASVDQLVESADLESA